MNSNNTESNQPRDWDAWAEKMPGLIRDNEEIILGLSQQSKFHKIASAGLGVALTSATFSKSLPMSLKVASGLTGAASFIYSAHQHTVQNNLLGRMQKALIYADELEQSPQMKKELAELLANWVTEDKIQRHGLEGAVLGGGFKYGIEEKHYFGNKPSTEAVIGR